MKCPKCDYLGFETGDRCKNCGYDFSLAAAAPPEPELLLREPESSDRDANRWLNSLEARLGKVRPAEESATTDRLGAMSLDITAAPPPSASSVTEVPVATSASPPPQVPSRSTSALPLFHPGGADWDEPLIKVPLAPRAPLAVRRTPDKPRSRSMPKPVRKPHADSIADPVLAFAEEGNAVAAPRVAVRASASARPVAPVANSEVSGPARRLIAAAVDHLILLTIDAVVIYFTFQIAGLPFSSWQSVPVLPLALFLLMVKGSYFCVFTALGGQTVGKMATGIRVVGDNDRDIEPSRAVQRTLAALASIATVGIGFAPVLFAGDRRALHDRVAGTRVVGPVHE